MTSARVRKSNAFSRGQIVSIRCSMANARIIQRLISNVYAKFAFNNVNGPPYAFVQSAASGLDENTVQERVGQPNQIKYLCYASK